MAQLMPLPLTMSSSSKSRLVLPSWFYLFGAGSPLERGCIQLALNLLACWKTALVMTKLYFTQTCNNMEPLAFSLPIPCLPMTLCHRWWSRPTRALKSPQRQLLDSVARRIPPSHPVMHLKLEHSRWLVSLMFVRQHDTVTSGSHTSCVTPPHGQTTGWSTLPFFLQPSQSNANIGKHLAESWTWPNWSPTIYRVAENKIPHQTISNIFATSGQILKILEAV